MPCGCRCWTRVGDVVLHDVVLLPVVLSAVVLQFMALGRSPFLTRDVQRLCLLASPQPAYPQLLLPSHFQM
jgi:hypothetical protein